MDQHYESSGSDEPMSLSSEQGAFTRDERHHLIEETAYFIAEQRGFQGGNPVDDWLQAEAKIESRQEESQRSQ